MLLALFNHAWPLAFYFLFAYWTEFQQATFMDPKLPSLKNIAFDFVFILLTREVSFYYVHRACTIQASTPTSTRSIISIQRRFLSRLSMCIDLSI